MNQDYQEAKNLTQIQNTEDFKSLLEVSKQSPVILLKHSPVCPISNYAYSQYTLFLENAPANLKAYLVDVVNSRPVSREIAEKTGVTHQSPQALIIKAGKCIWHDSHGNLTRDTFQEQLSAAGN
jgi:bacillithiol system protein YtxJ